jgi:hypothetical protein
VSSTQSLESDAILLVFAVLIASAARRTYLTYRGSRFSHERMVLFAGVYVAVGVLISATSFYEGVSLLFVPVYAFLLAVAAAGSHSYADRHIMFWTHSDGSVYFRGGVIIYLIYLAGLVVRLVVDYAVIGPDVFNAALNPASKLAGAPLYGTVLTDLLLMFGVGLILGRSARVLERSSAIRAGRERIPDAPSALGS